MPLTPAPEAGGGDVFAHGELLEGTYEIRALLGEGGMGQVFEAHDHVLDRRVAIKAPWPEVDPHAMRQEARALAAFRHPSLVTVHTLGRHRDVDYLVMERIYGVGLDQLLERRLEAGERFTPEEALEILIAIAEGLSVVHRAGFAHRDVKPGNIMRTPDQRIVLMDFGLVLREEQLGRLTTIAGSPPYMAPEALANDFRVGTGHLVDVYALGCIGYELLAGELPFVYESLTELWDIHASGRVPDVRELRPDVPVRMGAIVSEMMAKRPEARPESAEAVAWQLRAVRDQGPEVRTSLLPVAPRDVLLVEDDDDMARILGFYVGRILKGAKVRRARDGEHALRAVREHEPDVLLLDLHMPRMNGIELAMVLRGDGLAEDAAIIAVSAGAQAEDLQLLHALGIHHFVQKGSELGSRLEEVLRQALGIGGRGG